jgi:pimeloyl-ACP methyl ester carboxylesterase
MNRLLVVAWLLCSFAGCLAAGDNDDDRRSDHERFSAYRIVSVGWDRTIIEPLQKIDVVVQVGRNPINRFTMHYVSRRHSFSRGSIILIPSLLNNFGEYMIGDRGDPMQSFAAGLARANYDVYGYSPRTAALPPFACTTQGVDCSVMRDWNVATYVRDVEFIRRFASSRGQEPVVGGLSLGAFVGVAAVNANPSGYSGLLLWEGAPYTTDPTAIEMNRQNCANLTATIRSGVYWDVDFAPFLKSLAQNGEAATITFFGVSQPAIAGLPTWIQLVADPSGTHYRFASFPRVFDFVMAFSNVESLPILRDIGCALAGDRTHNSNLRNYRAPILAIAGGLGFGPYMHEVLDLTSSRRVRFEMDQGFGHLDAYLTAYWEKYTLDRVLDWLKTDVFRR